MIELGTHLRLAAVVNATLRLWPEHQQYLSRRFENCSDGEFATADAVADLVLALANLVDGGLDELCRDYRYLCEELVLPEEIYFRRHKRYRLSSFADAYRECYSNSTVMRRYMNGLLVSNALWRNHTQVVDYYYRTYLPAQPKGADHLEIGPGHGLLLYFAARHAGVGSVTGWDISATSIANTRLALHSMALEHPVQLDLRDLFAADDADSPRYDSVVLSEILEHLEDPVAALRAVRARLNPAGTVFINVPANSPAPDHIYLVPEPEHALELATAAELEVVDSAFFPMSGATLERAVKQKLAISCVVVARRPS